MKKIRDADTMNKGYGPQKKSTIPDFELDVHQDMPLYRQSNEEYTKRPVLPNYIDSNPNDVG
jgi:hypothetical protein